MPRNYKRKTETRYKLEDLQKAIDDVRSKKLTLGKAAIFYSVPKTTIFDYLKKEVIKQPRCGRKPVFTENQEMELEKHIIKCSKIFYGLTINMVRKMAFKFADQNKLLHSFDRTKKMAGKDWYHGFMQRHPRIALRKPEATSLNRINAFNETEIKIFYDNLEAIQNKYHLEPSRIFNVDETGITNVQRNSKILAPKGQKQIGKATSGERGTTTTVVCAFSAAGQYIPPFFIFKRKRMNAQLLKGGNADMIAAVSDSGWINENLFVDWLHHFISCAKPSKDRPIMLILDNHESHVSLDAYTLCRNNGIIIVTLPPHTSHRLQPLDLTFFSPLKNAYNKNCEYYMMEHPGRSITQYEIVELFTKAFNRCSNLEKAANGFTAAGIYPLQPTDFNQDESQTVSTQIITETQASRNQLESNRIDKQATNTQAPDAQAPDAKSPEAEVLSVSDPQIPNEDPKTSDTQNPSVPPNILLNESIPLSEIVNLPTIPVRTSKRNIRKKHSIILTSTPVKEELKMKQNKKISKESKKTEKISKKQTTVKRMKTEDQKFKKKKIRKAVKNFRTMQEFHDSDNENKNMENKDKKKDDSDNCYCIFCDEKYVSPPDEDWIMCYMCKNWAHEKCTDGQSSSAGYLCDVCRN